jgi:hypothetical protein
MLNLYGNYASFKEQKIGGTSDDIAYSLDVKNGETYIAGSFTGSADFSNYGISAPVTISSLGGKDAFIVKYNFYGELIWLKTGGGNNADEAKAIKVKDGEVYVAGQFLSDSITFDSTTLDNTYGQVFFGKFDLDGNIVFLTNDGLNGIVEVSSIGLDVENNIYIAGQFRTGASQTTFNGSPISNAGGTGNTYDAFIAKYSSSGFPYWAISGGGTQNDYGNAIAVDINSNIYLIGYYNGTANFNGQAFSSAGLTDMYLVKYGNPPANQDVNLSSGPGINISGTFPDITIASTFNILRTTANTTNVPSFTANSDVTQTYTLTGAITTASVMVSPAAALPAGVVISYARVSAANTVSITFRNTTGTAVAFPSTSLHLTAIQ